MYYTTCFHLAPSDALCVLSVSCVLAVRKDIQYCFEIISCLPSSSPQRHTTRRNIYSQISYTSQTQPLQSAKTYNIAFRFSLCLRSRSPQRRTTWQKNELSDLLHLTNTIIAVRKDIKYWFSIFSCVRNKTQPLQSAKTYDLLKHLLSDLLHLTNTIIAVHKDM